MSRKNWLGLIIVGLSGQIAWTVENMYFNVFMYNTITNDVSAIAAMVSSSAVVATLTTLIMGALSDKLGKRKIFISLGYIIWAFSVFAFAFVNASLPRSALLVIILDCIMTFFGSTANDAAFNAYVTERIEEKERTKTEAVIQILPMAALLIVFGLLDPFTQKGRWPLFFSLIAAVILISGLLSILLLEKDRGEKKDVNILECLTFGFRKKTIKDNPSLYIVLVAYALSALGMQVFFPYLIIYMQTFLGFESNYAVLLAAVLIAASVITVMLSLRIEKKGRETSAVFSLITMALGLLMMFFARSFLFTLLSGIVMMSGYLTSTTILSALLRDYTPNGSEGEIQGIRMIAIVMLPMVLGPYIGSGAIKNSALTYVELGVEKTIPTPLIFLIAAAVEILAIIPVIVLKRRQKA